MADWRDITDDREKYSAYLCSREWAEKREAVRERAHGKCERCFIAPMDACHHLTYERKYRESLDDLQAICNPCHQFIHGKGPVDPASFTKPLEVTVFDGDSVSSVMCPRCETSMVDSITSADVYQGEDGLVVMIRCLCRCCDIIFKLQVIMDELGHLTICYIDCEPQAP
jgi:hypothetical protein